jgi:hypothetical protein
MGPVYSWTSNGHYELTTAIGRQQIFCTTFLDVTELEAMRNQSAGPALSIFVRDYTQKMQIRNMDAVDVYVTIYHCKARDAIPKYNNAGAIGSISSWVSSLYANDGVDMTIIPNTPFMSQTFCKYVKVIKSKRYHLLTGSGCTYTTRKLKSFKYDAQDTMLTNFQTTHQTRFLLWHICGGVASQTANAQTTVTNAKLGIVFENRGRYTSNNPSTNIVSSFSTISTAGPLQIINDESDIKTDQSV